jgi:hypothetical protein
VQRTASLRHNHLKKILKPFGSLQRLLSINLVFQSLAASPEESGTAGWYFA